jgi:hypothetical protein
VACHCYGPCSAPSSSLAAPHLPISATHHFITPPLLHTPSLLLQDAHEFLNWLLNDISEVLEKEGRAAATAARRASRDASRSSSRSSSRAASPIKASGHSPTKASALAQQRSPSLQLLSQAAAKAAAARSKPVRTWVHDLFQVGGSGCWWVHKWD